MDQKAHASLKSVQKERAGKLFVNLAYLYSSILSRFYACSNGK